MTLFEKSTKLLELPAVLTMLAGEAVCDTAKERAEKLEPSNILFDVQHMLRETSDAKHMITLKGTPPFIAIREVAPSLARANLGGMLNTRELLGIAQVLRSARQVKAYAADAEKTSLHRLFASLTANKFLEEKITVSIAGEDEINDAASSDLADIRRRIRTANSKVRDVLQRMISSAATQKFLQEPIITMRSDRYVIPVKAEYKSSVPGLVHDVSSSGATFFIEPMQVVEVNNEIRELQIKEKKEIERILLELSNDAANYAGDISQDFELLCTLDLIFAKAKLSYLLKCTEPELSANGKTVLRHARHPLLPRGNAVPIDLAIGDDIDTLIITGPNTGGKTVSIKTLGLLCLMSQCGLHIPADDGSFTPVFNAVLADIGDEQSIEQSLSTFSSHMTNLVGILKEAGENTLLIFDELGAGTDPVEGAALAAAIIEYARARGSKLAVTTHYAELKIYATSTPGVMNASCEFDVETLKPTYRLLLGIPGKSNAFDISKRLGLSEDIISEAKKRVDRGSADFEEVLALLQKQRQEMEREELRTRKLLLEAEENSKRADELRKHLESEKEKAVIIAKREAEYIIESARKASDEVFSELSELRRIAAENENIQRINDARADIMRKLNNAESSFALQEDDNQDTGPSKPIKEGDTVEIIKIGTKAQVIARNDDGTLTLQAGIMKVRAKESELKLSEAVSDNTKRFVEKTEAKLRNLSVKPELDIRGLASDEALIIMERYLDSALLAKLSTVTIIHGKGTGALRTAVHDALRRNRSVKSYRLGKYGEGESGVTVAQLI